MKSMMKVMKATTSGRINYLFQKVFPVLGRSSRPFITIPIAANIKFLPDTALAEFESYYENVSRDIISNNLVTDIPKVNEILKKVLDYNVPNGRKIRASLIIATYQKMKDNKEDISKRRMEELYVLAWSYEMLISSYIIQDDIIDNSSQRRGKLTWHKCVGMNAINDSIVLEAASAMLIKKYFSKHKNYIQMVELLADMRRITRVGQLLETSTNTIDEYTKEIYNEIAHHKMGHCTIEAPVMLAALFGCDEDILSSNEVTEIFRELGILYNIMNDYLDCYGEEYFRKIGTDIQEKRCTWLIITALKKSNAQQRQILRKCYGSYDEDKLLMVKKVYEQLEIQQDYEIAESVIYDRIMTRMERLKDKRALCLLNGIINIVFRKDL